VRFFEFKNKDLESALVNTLMNMKGDADEKDQSSEISFDAVENIMTNIGYPSFNYDIFKQMYDQGEALKNVVSDFDEEKIVIKTEQDAEADPEMDFDNQGSTDKVKQMAKSAMNRRK
jgi:chemotaxis protein CheY-P-specific phosphatase CheC